MSHLEENTKNNFMLNQTPLKNTSNTNIPLSMITRTNLENELIRLQKTLKLKTNQINLENLIEKSEISLDDSNPINSILTLERCPELKLKSHIQGKIHGTISHLYTCESKYEVALKAVGAEKLNYLVVQDIQTAKSCMNFLKKNQLGRACFMPLNNLKVFPFDMITRANGKILGRAIDLIEFNSIYLKVMEFVFGRVIVVEDMNTAINLKLNATRVTLKGEIVESSNIISGGYS